MRRGVEWLLAEQEEDGSWFGRWGVNYVYGAGAALPALEAAGVPPEHPAMRRCVDWLEARCRTTTAASARTCRSYDGGEAGLAWHGRGESTPSQTAWALLALRAAGNAGSEAPRARLGSLRRRRSGAAGGTRSYFTGTGFPLDFIIHYHLYREVWPVMALGRVRRALAAGG